MFAIRPNQASVGNGLKYPQLNHAEITAFIAQHSVAISYWKATACPCTSSNTGQPDIRCNICKGLGWFYLDKETDDKYKRAQVHSRNARKEQGTGGTRVSGTATVTFNPGVIPMDGDLILVCADIEGVNNEFHVVGSTLRDGSSAETLRFRDIKCIEAVIGFDVNNQNVYPIEESKWSFNPAERRIVFQDGAIANGAKYSVRYLARPEWIIMGETVKPMLRVAHDENMPDDVRYTKDIVYPFTAEAVRLDRAITQRLRGNVDTSTQSTYNNQAGRGPFK